MPREFRRSDRMAGLLRRELAQLIRSEVNDPAVGFVGLSDVEVTRDLAIARVYITVFDSEKAPESIKALNRAAGFLRSRLGKLVTMRQVPELRFLHDASVETGLKLDRLIERAIASDPAHPEEE